MVVLALTFTVVFVLGTFVIGAFLLEAFRPETDFEVLSRYIADMLTVLVGALIGFIGGRAAGKKEEEDK